MNVPIVTYVLVWVIGRHPKVGVLIGSLSVVIFSILAILNWSEYQKLNKPPIEMTVAEAAKSLTQGGRAYLTVTDAIVDCNKRITNKGGSFTEIPFSDLHNTILVIGKYPNNMDCYSALGPLQGIGELHSKDRFIDILKGRIDFGLGDFIYADRVLSICTYCGPENSTVGIIVSIGLAACGLILVVLSPILHKKYIEQLAVNGKNQK